MRGQKLVSHLLGLVEAEVRTPWGMSQGGSSESPAPGIDFYSTASHGGYKLSPAMNAKVNSAWRKAGGWYEEDVDYAIVYVTFPQYFSGKVDGAKQTLKHYYPDEYATAMGEKVSAKDSSKLQDREFFAQHKNDYVVTAAWGSWHKDVPQGMVGVFAVKGGRDPNTHNYASTDHKYFLVPQAEYDKRGGPGGFVIDPAKHKEFHGAF